MISNTPGMGLLQGIKGGDKGGDEFNLWYQEGTISNLPNTQT